MPGEIPDIRFRLSQSFGIQPELRVDDGPGRGLLIGQHAPGQDYEAIFLGKHAEAPHRDLWMDIRGAHVLYVMGKRRSGKSYTLGAIAEGLAATSWMKQGLSRPAVLVLDTMNVFLTMPFGVVDVQPETYEGVRQLRKWKLTPESISLRILAPHDTLKVNDLDVTPIILRASDLGPEEWCWLFEVDPFSDAMGHLLTALYFKMTAEGVVRQGGERIPPRDVFSISDMLEALRTDQDLLGAPPETIMAITRRLQTMERYPLFGEQGLDIRTLLVPGQVTVLLMRDMEQEMRSVLVALIVKKLMRLRSISEQQERLISIHLGQADKYQETDPDRAANERAKAEECRALSAKGIPRSWLIIDEAHNYVPYRTDPPSRKPLKKYVDEGRNLGLSIVVATQQPSGLDASLQRNADLLLVHSLSHHDDIAAAAGMINTAVPDEIVVDGKHRISGARSFEALVRGLPIGYAIASSDRANRLFPVCIRPRITVHGGAEY